MNIDIAPDGTVYGIELLNASEQLAEDHGSLVIEVAGRKQKIALAALMPAGERYSQVGAAVFLSAKAGLTVVATLYDVKRHVVEVGAPPAGHGSRPA